MLKNLTIGARLASAFGTLIVLALFMGGMAVYQMSRINASTVDIAESWLPSVKTAGEIRNAINQFRRAENDHLLSQNDKEMDEVEKQLASVKQSLAATLKAYEPLITSPEEAKAYERFQRAWDAHLSVHAKLLPLSRGGEMTATDAKALLRGPSRQGLAAVFDALQEIVDINDKGAAQAAATAATNYQQARMSTVGLLLLMVVLSVATATWIVRSLQQQLGGEPGTAAELADRVARGDLSVPAKTRPGDTSSVMANLARMQASLSRVVADVRSNSEGVATASAQIAQGNQDLSQRTEEQASALQQTAATMEELGTTVRNNAGSAQLANQLAQSASAVAAQGGEVVGKVVHTMQGISDSSRRIGDIIGTIDGIAFQTNILALNAAVEAARAGEQGRGFAVVASEVRSLAQRSAEAAKEIKTLIGRSVEQVEQGTALVDQAGKTMGEIVGSIQRVSAIVAEITTASVQQSSGIQQVGDAVGQMDQATQQNAALVEESAAAAESLKLQAQQLVQAVAVFRLSPVIAAG